MASFPPIIFCLTPAPDAEISSPTLLRFQISLPGAALSLRCALPDAERRDYTDTLLATLHPNSDGLAEYLFRPEDFPHGPLTLRAILDEGEVRDVYRLQLYNLGGEPFLQGTASAPVPSFAEGLSLVYADDFTGPLSIAATGSSARYYSHKPGGGDFSAYPFTDYEAPGNPFSQKDSWLCIRAREATHTTGLLSSVRADGSGFAVKAPCYFECRFLAPNVIGSWPAFWLMTQDVHHGLHAPVDELDTIEAYGLEDLDHQNQVGYYVTSHRWNQDKKETIDPDYFLDMRSFGNRTGWDAAFHTYGTLITPEKTVYTCDNREVFSHPTQPYSARDPLFFMVNLAIGGNGWPWELSRYGEASMYVDFIRVWGLPSALNR